MKIKKPIIATIFLIGIFIIISEIVARSVLGLGDPPLSIADPEIEYLFKPSSSYSRFGNLVSYNKYSMRSEEFSTRKIDLKEFRVLMLGDSVINGGSRTDQSKLASEILKNRLASKLKRPVVVGNVSAGSWGPPNQLAYVKRFGFFDSDVVVLVLSSHDYLDVPKFVPLVGIDVNFPSHKPMFALQEVIIRYLLPRIGLQKTPDTSAPQKKSDSKDISESMSALRQIIALARASGAKVIVAQHLEETEIKGGGDYRAGHDVILKTARSFHVPVYQIGGEFKKLLLQGKTPYLDSIHPNDVGQETIANILELPLISIEKGKKVPLP